MNNPTNPIPNRPASPEQFARLAYVADEIAIAEETERREIEERAQAKRAAEVEARRRAVDALREALTATLGETLFAALDWTYATTPDIYTHGAYAADVTSEYAGARVVIRRHAHGSTLSGFSYEFSLYDLDRACDYSWRHIRPDRLRRELLLAFGVICRAQEEANGEERQEGNHPGA